jgi:RNA polymerase sigma-70 factor (ECF subfamily)
LVLSSLGDPVAEGIARRVSPSAVAALVDRTAQVRRSGTVAPPPVAVLSADRGTLDAQLGSAVAGDRRAVERLLASIRPLVVRYCRARIGRQERSFASADDVAQEVCLAVLKALPTYQDQGRPFLAFVYGIAAHKVADAHRTAARDRAEPVPEVPDGPDAKTGPEQLAMQGELSRQMAVLLQVLPEKQREILVLRVVIGLSAEETADAVGSTPGAVRVAQHRALLRLRKALGGR